MHTLPRSARAYLIFTFLLGLGALGWLVGGASPPPPETWLVALVLAGAAGLAQVLTVARARAHYSDHLTPAPVAAALLLLPSPLLALVVIVAFLPEWVWHRRKWYIQLFNIASWLVAVAAARGLFQVVTATPQLVSPMTAPAYAPGLALLVFLALQTGQLAVVLWLARGQAPHESGLFAPTKLGSELVLLAIGWSIAVAWLAEPIVALAAALPLVLIFQALHVPNLKEEAATDPKTGLANMRHFAPILRREVERAVATDQPISLLMCDLDFLRAINDTHGHPAGDVVIAGVADAIRESIRGCDYPARFGGEEFTVLLPGADRAQAWQVAERLRTRVEQLRFALGAGQRPVGVTVSIGLAGSPTDGQTAEALIREADLALYQAKREGRNRVITASRASRELVGEWTRVQKVDNLTATSHPRRGPRPAPRPVAPPPSVAAPAEPPAPRVQPPAAPPATAPPPRLPWVVSTLIAAVVALAAVGIVLQATTDRLDSALPLGGLVLFGLFVVLAEHLAVEIDGRGRTSVSATVVLAAAFLYHAPGILVTATIFAVWAKFRSRSPIHRMLFNFGAIAVAGLGADVTLHLLGPVRLSPAGFDAVLIPAALAGLTYYAINHGLLCLVRSLTEPRSAWEIWQTNYRWLWPHYPVLGILGALLAVGYLALGWAGLLALAAPIGMMHLAFVQYRRRARVHVNELERANHRLSSSYEATLDALSRALDTRDEETEEHSRRVQRYTELIARRYGMPDEEIAHLSRGALLHDIGKIGVPDAILLKPGRLTEAEREIMRRHPVIGYSMIAHIPFLEKAATVVLHHHEAYDGSGYPTGLARDDIPLGARIFAVIDTLDAITSDRPYRRARTYGEALAEIARCRGSQFDPRIVDVLLAVPIEELQACAQGAATWTPRPTTVPTRAAS